MGSGLIFMRTEQNMRVSGRMIFKMVGARRPGQMVLSMMETIKKEKNTDTVRRILTSHI
jgi:hypothetical protein